MLLRPLVRLTALLILLAVPRASAADVPGPRPVCDTGETRCERCWKHYGGGNNDDGFAACQLAAQAKGLREACSHRQGAGDAVFFCPAGVKVETKIVGGGCAGCAVGAIPGPEAMLAIAAGIAALAARRRRPGPR